MTEARRPIQIALLLTALSVLAAAALAGEAFSSSTLDIRHHELNVRLDPDSHRLEGFDRISFVADEQVAYSFYLGLPLTITRATLDGRRAELERIEIEYETEAQGEGEENDPEIQDHPESRDLQHNISILRDQMTQCKHTLTQLLADAGQTRAENASSQTVDHFLREILDKWKLMRPMAKFTYHCNGAHPAPQIFNTQPLGQSILNLLNNAADASLENIEIKSDWDNKELCLEILDFGKGLSEETAQRAGQAFFTNKPGHYCHYKIGYNRSISTCNKTIFF